MLMAKAIVGGGAVAEKPRSDFCTVFTVLAGWISQFDWLEWF